ncbi:autotransporter domain-containing protein [Bradyrhizobium liaoningense]|uniref:autotransporter family protein n=1 Tax=Bradyrhizobium liaoningense TaxID=43992 RepID=UPI001BA4A299|nr:autotransporter domain-containing protein [Bradyrhizobium liaoningense]MBR0984145.1 autotransporter domain-containing protein [Bradyrhizobium liaoningense]
MNETVLGDMARRSVRRSIRFLAPAVLVMPILAGGRAEAACTPSSPVNNTTVNCTGTTTNANGLDGYGTVTDVGDTYNIGSGATLTGTREGLIFETGTVNNSGMIKGVSFGVLSSRSAFISNVGSASIITADGNGSAAIGGFELHIRNEGFITETAVGGIGIDGGNNDRNEVINFGIVAADSVAIRSTGALAVTNQGFIQSLSANGTAIDGNTQVTVKSNSGAITGALGAIRSGFRSVDVTNESGGSIEGTTANSTAILAAIDAKVANSGRIKAGSTAIRAGDVVLINTVTGTISSNGDGVLAAVDKAMEKGNATVTNAGSILATSLAIVADKTATVVNSGTIAGGSGGIEAGSVILTNLADGNVRGGKAVFALNSAVVDNAGAITGTASDGIGIFAGDSATVRNSGVITGVVAGIRSNGTVDVTNTGRVSATDPSGIGIQADHGTIVNAGEILGSQAVNVTHDISVSNSGTISGDVLGILASGATIRNSGVIAGANSAFAIATVRALDLDNSGTIRGTGGSYGIQVGTAGSILNSGSIIADGLAISHLAASDAALTVANATSGMISGGGGIASAGTVNLVNLGTVRATDPTGGLAVNGNFVNATNSGLITGAIGILSHDVANITNSGTITGTGGTAIKLSGAADTLTLLPGSKINGVVDFGFGADVVNVNLSPISSKVSSLTTINLPTFVNFEGTINTNISGGSFNGPSVVSGTTLATLDPTALAQTDRSLMDFTGGVSSLVQSRLSGGAGPAGSNMMAMAYAPETAQAGPFTKAPRSLWTDPAPITVWANSFGGQRIQDETTSTLRATSTAWGGAIGIDRKVRPDWLVGAFLGGGQGGLSVDLNSQSVDTNYVFAGAYSRFEWASQFFDFTIQGGNADNKSRRLVLNNAAVGGMETATANYSGWYVSPEVAYGYRLNVGDGYVLTPTARLRYVAGRFDGYSETGSAQGLSVGGRTLQDFEERGEVDLSRVTSFGGGELKANIHGGVIALQRVGDTSINTVLLGQNLSFVTPGSRSTVGAVAGLGFDYRTGANVSVFGAVEGMMMSDQSRTGTAKGGVRVAF